MFEPYKNNLKKSCELSDIYSGIARNLYYMPVEKILRKKRYFANAAIEYARATKI